MGRGRRLPVIGLRIGIIILKELGEKLKGGPILGVGVPGFQHNLVNGFGAVDGTGHAVAGIHLLQGLTVVHGGVGYLKMGL